MGIYGNYIAESNNQVQGITETIESLFESVVYNEYTNYQNMLECCTNYEEKTILENKIMVLKEVSFKDIKNTILKILRTLKEKVQEFIQKIKEKFRSKELKKAQDDIKDLKKKIKDLEEENEDLEKDKLAQVADWRKANSNRAKAERERDEANKARSEAERERDEANKARSEAERERDEANKVNAQFFKALDNLKQNKIIYFNMFDFVDDRKRTNFQYYFRNIINRLNNSRDIDDFKYVKDEMIKTHGENLTILKDEIFEKLDNKNNSMSKMQIRNIVENKLSEIKPIENNDKFLIHLDNSIKSDNSGYCYDFSKEMSKNISSIESSVSGFFAKNIDNIRTSNSLRKRRTNVIQDDIEDTEENYSADEFEVIKYYKHLIFDLKCNMDYMNALCTFEGKRVGAILAALEIMKPLTLGTLKN